MKCQKDKSVLISLAFSSKDNTELAAYVSSDETGLSSALKIDDNVYVEKNTSTAMKISILRRIFALYEADPMDLVFYQKDSESKKTSDAKDIEEELSITLDWDRADSYKASWMCYVLNDVSVTNEADWPRMAKFHAEWSDKICVTMLPYLQDDNSMRLQNIAGIFREWAMARAEANLNLTKYNRTYTRFTTSGMTAILLDLLDAPSGWNTNNHYFYEIINRNSNPLDTFSHPQQLLQNLQQLNF